MADTTHFLIVLLDIFSENAWRTPANNYLWVYIVAGDNVPLSGAVPFAIGQSSVVRIPIPDTPGLAIELRPRGYVPAGGSTSTLFFQDISGKKHLRLDYGFNKVTNTVDYHWNQKGTFEQFQIADHAVAGANGSYAYSMAKYFKWTGRVFLVAGVAADVYSVVVATNRLKRASQAVSGWAGAWVGCKAVGAGGALAGTVVEPGFGTAIGGFAGCVIGGIGGYYTGSFVAGEVYDWAESTLFLPVPESNGP